jgi:hemerythrin-like domain-containing protein
MDSSRADSVAAAGARGATAGGVDSDEGEVSPPEDLMREHGVLNRILLIYEEGIHLLESRPADLRPAVLSSAAGLVRSFIEDYHESLEENYLFPRFEKAGKLTDLVHTLRAQHHAGRRLTDDVLRLAVDRTLVEAAQREALATVLRQFIRMYRPHEAREDTVLFPALRKVVSANEFDSLGEEFERQEHRRFGEDGFERIVARVAALEGDFGIADLARFTPER